MVDSAAKDFLTFSDGQMPCKNLLLKNKLVMVTSHVVTPDLQTVFMYKIPNATDPNDIYSNRFTSSNTLKINRITCQVMGTPNTDYCAFNIEKRGEFTPETAGTKIVAVDLVADVAGFLTQGYVLDSPTCTAGQWLVLTCTGKTAAPTALFVSVELMITDVA